MFDQYYDEPIYEPSLADEILSEASEKLMDAIKQDVAAHIKEVERKNERLEKENKDLREKVHAVNREKADLQKQREELKRKASRMSVEEFLGQRGVIMYRAGYDYIAGPKCVHCDDQRNRPYITPLGNDATEKCPCSVRHKVYTPNEYRMSSMERGEYRGEVRVWFKRCSEDGDSYSPSQFVKDENVYDGESNFADLDMYKTYFSKEEECQEYCDWLNDQIQND